MLCSALLCKIWHVIQTCLLSSKAAQPTQCWPEHNVWLYWLYLAVLGQMQYMYTCTAHTYSGSLIHHQGQIVHVQIRSSNLSITGTHSVSSLVGCATQCQTTHTYVQHVLPRPHLTQMVNYCTKEYHIELLMLWLDVEHFRGFDGDQEDLTLMAQHIGE